MTDRPDAETVPARLTPRMRAILVVFAAVMLTGGTDLTKVTVGLPDLSTDLDAGPLQGLWIADVYGLAAGALILPAAVLADTIGRKRIYLTGLALAALGAAVAAAAPDAAVVIVGRVLQGTGGALLIAGTVTIIRVTFPGMRLRAIAYGVWAASFSVGSAFGPLVGGVLVEYTHWRWLFAVNVPILAACLVAAALVLGETRNPDPPVFDLASAVSVVGGLGLLVLGLKTLAAGSISGVPPALAAVALVLGIALLLFFVLRQLRLPRAYLDVRLFRIPAFSAATVIALLTQGSFAGVLFLLTQRFQEVESMSAIDAGWSLLPLALASAAGAVIAPHMQDALGAHRTLAVGVMAAALGLLGLGILGPGSGARGVAMVVLGLGAGNVMTIGANLIMSSAPENRAADAGAVQESALTVGGGAGIALLGAAALLFAGGGTPALVYGDGADIALRWAAAGFTLITLVAVLVLRRVEPDTAPD